MKKNMILIKKYCLFLVSSNILKIIFFPFNVIIYQQIKSKNIMLKNDYWKKDCNNYTSLLILLFS